MNIKSFDDFVNEKYSPSNLEVMIDKMRLEGKSNSSILMFFDLLNIDLDDVKSILMNYDDTPVITVESVHEAKNIADVKVGDLIVIKATQDRAIVIAISGTKLAVRDKDAKKRIINLNNVDSIVNESVNEKADDEEDEDLKDLVDDVTKDVEKEKTEKVEKPEKSDTSEDTDKKKTALQNAISDIDKMEKINKIVKDETDTDKKDETDDEDQEEDSEDTKVGL